MVDLVQSGLVTRFEQHQAQKIHSLKWPSVLKDTAKTYLEGGKYLRSQLFFKILSSKLNDSAIKLTFFDVGMSLEWIHSYSLVHDDLPCMDDDDFRRSKPSAHRLIGEDNAVLLGDALLTASFELLSNLDLPAEQSVALIQELSSAAGGARLIAGQVMDLESEKSGVLSKDYVLELHSKKTGALFGAAAAMACVCSQKKQDLSLYRNWGVDFGVLYQLVDDYLDTDGLRRIQNADQVHAEILNRLESLGDRAKALGFNVNSHLDLFEKMLNS